MPSRQRRSLLASPPLSNNHRRHHSQHHVKLLFPLLAGALTFTVLCFIIIIFFFYRKLSRNRTAPSDLKSPNHHQQQQQCRRFSYSLLRSATASFSPSNQLGHGGFGSVYKAILPPTNQPLAVKLMDPNGSLQGEREFTTSSLSPPLCTPLTLSLSWDFPRIVVDGSSFWCTSLWRTGASRKLC